MSDIRKPSQTTSSEHGFDAEFDAFLREEDSRLAALFRKLPHPDPDAELDARVRAQARSALREHGETAPRTQQPSAPASRSRARRWLPAFGLAATLLLVAGLAWRLVPPTAPTREATPAMDTAASALASDKAAPAPAQPPLAPAPPSPQASVASMAEEPPPRRAAKSVGKTETEAAVDAVAAKADSRATVNGAFAVAPKTPSPAFAAPASAEPAAFPHVAEAARAKNAAPSKPAPPPPVAAAPPAVAMQDSAGTAAAVQYRIAAEDRAEAKPTGSGEPVARVPGFVIEADRSGAARYRWEVAPDLRTAAQARSGVYPPDLPPPAAWAEIVRRMRRDGHRDAAKQALAELRARHPDYPIPDDLRLPE